MLYRNHCHAVHVQYFRRYRYGRYLLRCTECCDRKGKRKEDQYSDVCSGCAVHTEVCCSVMQMMLGPKAPKARTYRLQQFTVSLMILAFSLNKLF